MVASCRLQVASCELQVGEESRSALSFDNTPATPQLPTLKSMLSLTPHLFWDVRAEDVDLEQHAAWLTRRVLEYGDWPDWQALVRYYGKERLREIATSIRSLDPKALAFCRIWFDLPDFAFRCSKHPLSL